MNKILLIILIFFLILIPVLLFVAKNDKTLISGNNTSSTGSTQSANFISPNSLGFPSGFSFVKADSGPSEGLGKNALYYDYNPHALSGTEWVATKTVNSDTEYAAAIKSFDIYYNSKIYKNGWMNELKVNGHTLQPLAADSTLGRIYGYLKYENGNVQVALMYNQKASDSYPTTVQFRVFLSSTQPLNKIVK